MIDVVLVDIEGTVTPLAFVKDVLFPLARGRLRAFVSEHRDAAEVRAALDAARALLGAPDAPTDDVIAALERWSDEDRKAPPLKALQGLVWREAYESGTVRAPVYPDVRPALARLRAEGARVVVYSSGSVLAQRLLFAHTTEGDLTPLFDGYLDGTIGAKTASASYDAIARALGATPERMGFLSDASAELGAALAAGVAPIEVVRDGATPTGSFARVTTFAGLARASFARIARDRALSGEDRGRCEALLTVAAECHHRGWTLATSGNFSVRLDAERIAITASGRDKGRLTLCDLGVVGTDGAPRGLEFRPSAETPLHCALYRRRANVGAVVHTHSVAATVVSRRLAARGEARLLGFEMQKALPGVTSHAVPVVLPVYAATQDMDRLAAELERTLPEDAPGYLLEGHGLTTWGENVEAARRHVEALEFLLSCALAEG